MAPAHRKPEVPKHGFAQPRGQSRAAGTRPGRFGRMFPFLPDRDPGSCAIEELVDYLYQQRDAGRSNTRIPAGYTYLGQFIDHDITFDPTSKLQRDNDPAALVNFRTPRLDLDSLYGSGPADQPFLYDWEWDPHPGVMLLVDHPEDEGLADRDLPRNRQGRALIGDARNDENLIVAQLHLLFIRFHNAVVRWLAGNPAWQHPTADGLASGRLFDEAQRIVRWHYQWIVLHDFLRRIAGDDTACSVVQEDTENAIPRVARRFFRWHGEPAIPVEFSAAAYRFGHSMVRDSYVIKAGSSANLFPGGAGGLPDLAGFRRLTCKLEIDWKRFFFVGTPAGSNRSMTIDTGLVGALFRLPRAAAPLGHKLALLNLERGRALGLPAGRDVAQAMSIEPLRDEDLLPASLTPDPISQKSRDALLRATPLWFYVLREAELEGRDARGRGGGTHLGPVGGRIVAEVLAGLVEADPHSYLRQWPTWKPGIEQPQDDFTMLDLLDFVGDHERSGDQR